jgi:diguanylate cyclase (GGDEF)-like protein
VAEGAKCAMLFVDLDRLKMVNDGLGHARGNQLLIMVANRLRVVVNAEYAGSARTRPLLARLADDEFTIFFPDIETVAEAIETVAQADILRAMGCDTVQGYVSLWPCSRTSFSPGPATRAGARRSRSLRIYC